MSKHFEEIRTEVEANIKDHDEFTAESDRDLCINRAIRALSRKAPYLKTLDQQGDGSADSWAIPSDYYPGFSSLSAVYFPWDKDDYAGSIRLEREYWDCFEYESGTWYFRLKGYTPGATEYVRFQYLTYHVITVNSSTITDAKDEDAIIACATGLCFRLMQARALAQRAPSDDMDSIDYEGRAKQYGELAETSLKESGLYKYLTLDEVQVTIIPVGVKSKPNQESVSSWLTH